MENLVNMTDNPLSHPFWKDKHVLLTGHTGFKGSWAGLWLEAMGAHVTGLSLPGGGEFFESLNMWIKHIECDLRDRKAVHAALAGKSFDIVIHMAAQSLVRESYRQPVDTFATNVMGTLHLLEALQQCPTPPKVILVVTSDKVYRNADQQVVAFTEQDALGGDDPYSASKACCEIATNAWRQSFLDTNISHLITARAGNVIGGGDWSTDRLIPDFIRARTAGSTFNLRNPNAVRPWQHVCDVLSGYFTYIQTAMSMNLPESLNFGPDMASCLTTSSVIDELQRALGSRLTIETGNHDGLKEKSYLALNASCAREILAWQPRLSISESIQFTADWYHAWENKKADMRAFTLQQLIYYTELP